MKRQRIGKVLVWSGASDKESVSIAVSNRQAHFNNDVKLEVRICGVTKRIGIKEAKEILKAKGASYKNLTFDSDSTVGKYAGNIMAFPTTVLVDKDGNIIGEPFMGGIDDQSNYDQLMKQIQSVLDQK